MPVFSHFYGPVIGDVYRLNNPYIHIGHRKTATTWMQNILFNNLKDVNFIGKTENYYPEWMIEWHYLDDFEFHKKIDVIRNHLKHSIVKNRINIISSEAFTNTGVIVSQAKRIKCVVPHAKIILVLRNPVDLVKSHYKSDVGSNNIYFDLSDYIDWKRTPYVIGKRRPIYLPDFFFSETIELYNNLFGKKNVCILRYEDMVNDFELFFKTLGDFLTFDFKYDDLENMLAIRVNDGPKFNDIGFKRACNLYKILKDNFPSVTDKITIYDIMRDIGDSKITTELETKLFDYFNGKTGGYY